MSNFLFRFFDFWALIRVMSPIKILNYLKLIFSYWYSVLSGNTMHCGAPAAFSFEPVAACNLKCPECPAGLMALSRDRGMAQESLFIKALDEFSEKAFYLTLYFQGEPFLHPHFSRFVRLASERRLYTATSTNGHFLNENTAQELVKSGLNRLIVSLDGLDQHTYEKYRKGGDLQKVCKGIETVRRVRTELKSLKPLIVVQFIVMKHNEHQMNDVRQFAYVLGADVVELKTAQIYDMKDPNGIIPVNDKHSRYIRSGGDEWKLKSSLPNHCFRMWSAVVVSWDGNVLPCCYDKDANFSYGNLNDSDIQKILYSKEANEFRTAVFSCRKEMDICSNCPEK